MRVAILVLLLCACSSKDRSGGAARAAPDAAAAPTAVDPAGLIEGIVAAQSGGDPAGDVVRLVARTCGAACPCVDPVKTCDVAPLGNIAQGVPSALAFAGKYLADQAARAAPAQRDVLAAEMRRLAIWIPASTVELPGATSAVPSPAWATIVVAKDGTLAVGRAERIRLTLQGAVRDPAVAPVAVDAGGVRAKLTELRPAAEKLHAEHLEEETLTKPPETDSPEIDDAAFGPDPCGAYGWGAGTGSGYGTAATRPRYVMSAVKGTPVADHILLADVATPSERVFAAFATIDGAGALGVQASGRVAALGVTLCHGAPIQDAVALPLAAAADPATLRASYDEVVKKAGQPAPVRLVVAMDATYRDLIAAIDALLERGAPAIELESEATTSRRVEQVSFTLGTPTVTGALDVAIVRRFIKRNANKLRYCYEKTLIVRPGLAGDVMAELTIDAEGRVPTAKASGLDRDVETCVVSYLKGIEFPEPTTGTVTVTFPMSFAPGEE